MFNVNDLRPATAANYFDDLLQTLATKDIDNETKQALLESLVSTLDDLDADDTFGTEGWRHSFGFE